MGAAMKLAMTVCASVAIAMCASVPATGEPAPQPKIEVAVKLDLVEAMREFARWVAAIFTTADAAAKEARRTSVAEIGTDLLEIAAIKRAIGKSYEPQSPDVQRAGTRGTLLANVPFAGGYDVLEKRTNRLDELVKALNRRLREVDPDWRSKNVETVALAFE